MLYISIKKALEYGSHPNNSAFISCKLELVMKNTTLREQEQPKDRKKKRLSLMQYNMLCFYKQIAVLLL